MMLSARAVRTSFKAPWERWLKLDPLFAGCLQAEQATGIMIDWRKADGTKDHCGHPRRVGECAH